MIKNDEQFKIVRKQMQLVESILRSMKCEILPNVENYHLYAESTADQIMKLRREIDEYIGLDEYLRRRVEANDFGEAAGTLRQIDLDARTFVLRNPGGDLPDLTCEYGRYLDDQVKAYLDQKVVVYGRLRMSDKTQRQTMEVDTFETKPATKVDEPLTPRPLPAQGAA
jgi:hypothetical protein